MSSLYLNACYENDRFFVDTKTFIVMYIHKLSEVTDLKLKIRITKNKIENLYLNLDPNEFNYEILSETSELHDLCIWPLLLLNNYVVSGLCSVARQICKLSSKENVKQLLGFRDACLVACAESSVWTKYCEIDIILTINNLLNHQFIHEKSFIIPNDVFKYEKHLSKPVRIHNIYKIARNTHNDQSLKSSTPREELKVMHEYAEGPFVTLADIILYLAFQIFFKYCQQFKHIIDIKLPLITAWFNRLNQSGLPGMHFCYSTTNNISVDEVTVPSFNSSSLYNAEHTKITSIKHTKQYKIESALSVVDGLKNEIINSFLPLGINQVFNWKDIPIDANPEGGALPKKRASRKCEQLENLAKAALEVVGNKSYKIVDFCSGSGHLGILVATLLPNCQIYLVENKEMSLGRALETISKLGLTNVFVVQSNLDYFVAKFDLGLALHACGVATDLVIQMCIKKKAHFICCPCCYGGIKDCHEVSYPRSNKFQNYFCNIKSQYFNLAHAADQTHGEQNAKTKQGYFCMDVIDTDRKLMAESFGYEVHLGKLQPVTCTNKNNLLVGIYTTKECD